MRFESIHVSRYGCLADLSTGDEPLGSIVVVLGPNESGKSTFFSFLTTLLYGFHPATRASHPFTPWAGGDCEGRAALRLDDGTAQEVSRRLMSSARGLLTTDGRTDNIRNRPLKAVGHVTRVVFRQVYALTLAELAGLEGESWALVQDRLVGAMGVKDLRPARSVAAEFEKEANRLWRPDNRGRPRVRELRSELADLNERRRQALKTDGLLRTTAGERAEAGSELAELRREREREGERSERLEHRLNRLLPVRRSLARISELRRDAGPPEALKTLPDDPPGRLETLRNRRLEAGVKTEECDREAALCQETLDEYRERYRKVAEAEDAVRDAAAGMMAMADMRKDLDAAAREVTELEASCAEQGSELFTVSWDEVPPRDYAEVPHAELRERVLDYRKSRERLLAQEQNEKGDDSARVPPLTRPGWGSLAAGLVLLAGGLGLGAWPLFFQNIALRVPGGTELTANLALIAALFLAVGGLTTVVVRADRKRRYSKYTDAVAEAARQRKTRIAMLTGKAEEAREGVQALITALPIADAHLEAPGLELPAALERVTELAERLQRRREDVERRRTEIAEASARIGEVREALAFHSGGETPVAARVLISLLAAALKSREAAGAAEQQLARINDERRRAEAERDAAARQLGELEAQLAPFAADDPEQAARIAADRLECRRRASQLRQELERAHPDLDDIAREIAAAEAEGEGWEGLQEKLDNSYARREDLANRAERLQARIGRLETEIEHLRKGDTADTIEGRIEVVRQRVREAKEGRDRAFVLARLVREADRRFRDENQPELLLRASRYLSEVTRGRYDRIELGDPGDESFQLREPAGTRTRKVGEALSQGTKEQVYLALRLAIISHLDADRERIPLFMDETLVNWDAWRRDRAFGILERVAAERQVFIFTCHPAMAAEMEDRGGRIIPLAEV